MLIYGDSLTAGAPSMVPFGEALCQSLESMGGPDQPWKMGIRWVHGSKVQVQSAREFVL